MKTTFIALALLAVPSMMWAQDENEINIDAQIRARAEYRNGYQSLRGESAQPASFINERARLSTWRWIERQNLNATSWRVGR